MGKASAWRRGDTFQHPKYPRLGPLSLALHGKTVHIPHKNEIGQDA
jgi:hypothetical protein